MSTASLVNVTELDLVLVGNWGLVLSHTSVDLGRTAENMEFPELGPNKTGWGLLSDSAPRILFCKLVSERTLGALFFKGGKLDIAELGT